MSVQVNQQLPLFSLGGVLRLWWRSGPTFMPWACVASLLASLSMWDLVVRAGRPDFILLGLAAYELMVGLTE